MAEVTSGLEGRLEAAAMAFSRISCCWRECKRLELGPSHEIGKDLVHGLELYKLTCQVFKVTKGQVTLSRTSPNKVHQLLFVYLICQFNFQGVPSGREPELG